MIEKFYVFIAVLLPLFFTSVKLLCSRCFLKKEKYQLDYFCTGVYTDYQWRYNSCPTFLTEVLFLMDKFYKFFCFSCLLMETLSPQWAL